MTKKYKIGPDIDLDEKEVYTRNGRRLTEAEAEELAERAVQKVAGRPSLTGGAKHSPQISYRVPEQLERRARKLAEREGKTLSQLGREALEEYVEAHTI
jgi:predicted HicB family RNase H-like nuclease